MKCMNLVMDDFYHAHAHSLRPLCIEGCGDLVANSYVGDCALTRTRNTEKKRTGDVTRTITSNVNESIENGSVTINNNLMGKTVTEMMPAGDYKTEVTAMNYETMFMVNGEHKVMDMSTKKTVIDLGITDLVFDSPWSTTDANIVSETFVGVKNSNHFAACYGFHIGSQAECYAGPKIVDKRHYIIKSSTVLDSGEMTVASFKLGKLSYKLILIGLLIVEDISDYKFFPVLTNSFFI